MRKLSRRRFVQGMAGAGWLAVLSAPAYALRRTLKDLSKVTWYDDFLGININPSYNIHQKAGSSLVRFSSDPDTSVGGWLKMQCTGSDKRSARFRLGEDDDDSKFHHPNFSVAKRAICEVRIKLNRKDLIGFTVGFTGLYDPYNILDVLYLKSYPNR